MNIEKIKIGRSYPYSRRAGAGTGKVVRVETKLTGAWVTLFDKAIAREVTVRPSQVGASAAG